MTIPEGGKVRFATHSTHPFLYVQVSAVDPLSAARVIARVSNRYGAEGLRFVQLEDEEQGNALYRVYSLSFRRDLAPTWWTRLRWAWEARRRERELRRQAA